VLDDERQMMEIMFIPVHHELTIAGYMYKMQGIDKG
jgi:hypothetical protein